MTRSAPAPKTDFLAKSRRAQIATSQRYTKSKKAKNDSTHAVDNARVGGDDAEDKRQRSRERNRMAAAKCRMNNKITSDCLKESARHAAARNSKLRAEERELRNLFTGLRNEALAHDPSRGCICKAIHDYNLHKAHETATAATSLCDLITPWPLERSVDSSSSSMASPLSKMASHSRATCGRKTGERSQAMMDSANYNTNSSATMP